MYPGATLSTPPANLPAERSEQTKRLMIYFSLALALIIGVAGFLVFKEKRMFAIAALAAPVAVVVICHPRLALYQFIFSLYIGLVIIPASAISITFLSAVIMIAAATLDTLVKPEYAGKSTALTGNFLLLLGALILSGLFAYNPELSIRTIIRVTFLLVTFLALTRLLRYVNVREALGVYFFFGVIHAIMALVPFVLSGGVLRSFAFAPAILDELLMLAIPIGLAFYLSSAEKEGRRYLIGTAIIFAGLMATQSRAPIAFALLGVLFVAYLMTRKNSRLIHPHQSALVRKRIGRLFVSTIILGLLALILFPDTLAPLIERFEGILTTSPGGTFRLRMILWQTALQAFVDNPILGAGPGSFTSLQSIYSALSLDPAWFWYRGLSATSLFLHYLAETGIVGAGIMLALFVNQYRLAKNAWRDSSNSGSAATRLALYAISFLLLITTIIEAGWLWGHASLIGVLFLALISAQSEPQG